MFKKVKPDHTLFGATFQFPHCDQRILHAPGECQFCDKHPDWQELRTKWGIAFTGYEPEGTELPCPADHARGDNHKLWYGNTAKPANRCIECGHGSHIGPCTGLDAAGDICDCI